MKEIANALTCCALIAAVTILAIHFNQPALMWFYLLILCFV